MYIIYKEEKPVSVSGNINEVLKQIQLLIRIYGNVTIRDIEKSVTAVRSK